VLGIAAERPELAAPIVGGHPDLLAEVVVAARLEQARSVADVLLRRTRLGLVAARSLRTAEDARPVAQALGAELGWGGEKVSEEASAWVGEVASEGIDPAAGD
jgi:glycerol-3-phosphate dehydrogenase